MTWFRVDDGFYDHPKVIGLAESPHYSEALALWLLAGTWAAKQLTDGFVPTAVVRRLGSKEAAEALAQCRLWTVGEGGFWFHEWAEHQPSRREVEAKRAATAERQRRYRERQREANDAPVSNATRDALLTPSVTPPRPDPSRPERESPRPRSSSSALDQEFSERHREWAFAREEAPETLRGSALTAAAERAADVATAHGCEFSEAVHRLCDAAAAYQRERGKDFVFAIRECRVPKPVPTGGESTEDWEARQKTLEENGPEYLQGGGQ